MIQIVQADGAAEQAVISAMRARAAQANQAIDEAAAEIMDTVKEKGFSAVREYSLRFDKAEPREIPSSELDAAYGRCPKELIAALERAAAIAVHTVEDFLARHDLPETVTFVCLLPEVKAAFDRALQEP